MTRARLVLFLFLILFSITGNGQDVYKTPSGKKYHLRSCKTVENVSSKLAGVEDINKFQLTPCKICKPPVKKYLQKSYSTNNKAVGVSSSVQCNGITQKGKRCKHKTSLANGYCYQHTRQDSPSIYLIPSSTFANTTTCGARNKSGGSCKRKVKPGRRCYQHQ